MNRDTLIYRVSLIWMIVVAIGCGIGCVYALVSL